MTYFPFNRKMLLAATVILTAFVLVQCSKDEEEEDCISRTKRDQYFGYEVWAGDSALFAITPYDPMYYYDIDKYYTLIGSGTTTKTFNTGSYKYYVIAARWYCCVDAIQFADSTYYNSGQGYTLIGGLAEHPPGGPPRASRFLGAPDGISGNLGYKDLCKEPGAFGGFITDNATITSRGGGLTVYVVDNCN